MKALALHSASNPVERKHAPETMARILSFPAYSPFDDGIRTARTRQRATETFLETFSILTKHNINAFASLLSVP